MLVANSFDLWQRDTFFSAAEEVQQSADIMESAFRTWLRERKEGIRPQFWDDLSRELQMALGTAKWQLEEFERAVRLSYRTTADEITRTRHRQFVSAIQDQISHVETALMESFDADGQQSLRWVKLDEKECDDLALFLSGTPASSGSKNDGDVKLGSGMTGSPPKSTRKNFNNSGKAGAEGEKPNRASSENVSSDTDTSSIANVDLKQSPGKRDISGQPDRILNAQRTRSSPNLGELEIVIDSRYGQEEATQDIDATPKEKGFKPYFRRQKYEDSLQAKAGILSYSPLRRINCINQLLGLVARGQRQSHMHVVMPVSCNIRFMLVFMLAVFLVVPFLVFST